MQDLGASSVNINEQQSADSPSLKLGDDAGSHWGAARHHSPPPRFWYNAPPPRREQSKGRYTNDFNSVHTRVLSVQSPPTPSGVSHDCSRLSCDIRGWAGAHVFMPVRGRCLRAHVTLIAKNCPRRLTYLLWAELHMLAFYVVFKGRPHVF